MSTGEVKKVSTQDIQRVQNLIERCLLLYMSQKEVVSTLLHQAKIAPSFTKLVWQKLEEENQDFFKAYHLRLIVKDQIMKFNKLLQTQAEGKGSSKEGGFRKKRYERGPINGKMDEALSDNQEAITASNVKFAKEFTNKLVLI